MVDYYGIKITSVSLLLGSSPAYDIIWDALSSCPDQTCKACKIIALTFAWFESHSALCVILDYGQSVSYFDIGLILLYIYTQLQDSEC